jgi:hypothetical protein
MCNPLVPLVFAQMETNPAPGVDPNQQIPLSSTIYWIVALVLCLLFTSWIAWLATKLRLEDRISGLTYFKLAGVCLILGAGLAILTFGGIQQQMAQLFFNILAAVAGYVFGRGDEPAPNPAGGGGGPAPNPAGGGGGGPGGSGS